MKKQILTLIIFGSAILLQFTIAVNAWGGQKTQASAPQPSASAPGDDAQRVDTQIIKKKYWARGDQAEIGVVQNRLYSKAHHFEFSLLTGLDFTDPMLSVYAAGGRFGYHFSEYFSLHLLAFKTFSYNSSTQNDLLSVKSANQLGDVLNTNPPSWYVGSEAQWSLLYGKLSVVGKAIIHYDMHFMVGGGVMKTESGADFEQHIGIGQQFFLSKTTFINVDYRLMHYHETLLNKVIPNSIGQPVGTRENWSNVFTIGFGFLFGHGPKL